MMSENKVGCNLVRLVSKPDEPEMSIADQLRDMAAAIEYDEKKGVKQPTRFAWVISAVDYDAKETVIYSGIFGESPMPKEESYFLFGQAMRALEGGDYE